MRTPNSKTLITLTILFLILVGFGFYIFLHGITPGLNYPEKFTYYLHNGDFTYSEQEVMAGEEIYNQLVRWIDQNTGSWKPSFTKHFPIQLFHSEDLSINVTMSAVIINYSIFGGLGPELQVYKEIDSAESVLGRFTDQ